MNLIAKLLRWNDGPSAILRNQMRESTDFLSAHTEDLTRTVVLKAEEIKRLIDGPPRLP